MEEKNKVKLLKLKNAAVFFGLIKPTVQILKYIFSFFFPLCLSAEFYKDMGSNYCVHTVTEE